MSRHILLFALLLSSSYGYTQSISFGISKSELINIEGAPDAIYDSDVEYFNVTSALKLAEDNTLPVAIYTNYIFNSWDELVEITKTSSFIDSSIAKNKINNLLKSAKQKYQHSKLGGNEMLFGNTDSNLIYSLTIVPQKLFVKSVDSDSVLEKFYSIKYLE